MANFTVSELMSFIAATVNQDPTTPAVGSTDYTLWISFLERAQREWQEAHDWEETRKYFYPAITAITSPSISSITIALPNDFYRLAAPPINWSANEIQGVAWPQVLPEQKNMLSVFDKWFFILGDQNNGFNMLWNPGTLASGASIEIQYFYVAPSLASSGQIPIMRDPLFLVDRTVGFILESRYDPRFQEFEAKAREKLLQMISNHDAHKYSSFANPEPVLNTNRRMGFRWGRD